MSSSFASQLGSDKVTLAGWQIAKSSAGKRKAPVGALDLEWLPAEVPGTVAAQLWGDQPISYGSSLPLDDDDFWYRVEFRMQSSYGAEVLLHLEGLATFAEVWLDDNLILESDNMFCAHTLDVSQYCEQTGAAHWLYIRFCALTPFINLKHPRAKWRTPFVQHRNLRFVRTSLIGRTPGLQPLIPVVGPWRPVFLEVVASPKLTLSSINVELVDELGVIDVVMSIQGLSQLLDGDSLQLHCDGEGSTELDFVIGDDGILMARGRLEVEKPNLWWPHTHGDPATYRVSVEGRVGGKPASLDLQPIGFRTVELLDPFAFSINGVQIFCRGACWRPLEFLSMNPSTDRLRRVLDLAVAAGMNMLRIPGETAYESDEFYRLCDELGILVWQDFMFARLDYPVEDDQFLKSITKEATQLLERLASHPCLTVLCGNTEVAQQAAMLGLEREKWSNRWFDSELTNLCAKLAPGIPYWRSSPDGGDMPFYMDSGVSHYFGVGAYWQELSDAIINAPVFASECLAFGIPSLRLCGTSAGANASLSSPADANADWSFMDVTEHYASTTFGVDLDSIRELEPGRHRIMCGLAVGEVMHYVLSHWRKGNVACSGSLLIALNDSVEGKGWGLIDSKGVPKAAYYYLKRACKVLSLTLVDQGINGLKLVVHNDRPTDFEGSAKVTFLRQDGVVVHNGEVEVNIPARTDFEVNVDSVIGHFVDSSYAYRFGEVSYDFILGELFDEDKTLVEENVFRVDATSSSSPGDVPIDVELRFQNEENGCFLIEILASSFVQSAILLSDEIELEDNCIDLLPGRKKCIRAKRVLGIEDIKISMFSLNMNGSKTYQHSFSNPDLKLKFEC